MHTDMTPPRRIAQRRGATRSCHPLSLAMVCSAVLLLRPAAAQQPAVVAEQVDRAQLQSYIQVMRSELERAEARVGDVTVQLSALDDDIEARLNRIVSLLSSTRDSTDSSDTRMRRAKEQALEGLKASAVHYAQQRDRRKKEMESPAAPIAAEELAGDVAELNARIETRITQSLAIATSLVLHEEGQVEKYRDSDDHGDRETLEFRRRQKDAAASVAIKTELVADLRKSIEKLTRDVSAREAELGATMDPAKRELATKDIQTMRQTIESRRAQIEELVTAPQASTRAVGSQGAFEMVGMLEEMAAELKKDVARSNRLVQDRDAARSRIKPIKERLERATAMLTALNETPATAAP